MRSVLIIIKIDYNSKIGIKSGAIALQKNTVMILEKQ